MAHEVTRGRLTSFRGTPLECEVWLRGLFDRMRTRVGQLGNDMDVFERTVWDINLYSTDGLARDRARTEFVMGVGMLETERELADLARNGRKLVDEAVDSPSDTMSSEAEGLEG